MNRLQLDRWLLNVIFNRSRIFKVCLRDCCDEFGHSFGANGSHFFVRALARGDSEAEVRSFLSAYYAAHPIRSFNQVVGHAIGDPVGEQYFCPWETERVRPLEKFAGSHKAGPTPEDALARIVSRLLAVLARIRARGFRQFSMLEGFPRVIAVINRSGRCRYIVRDGQHRAAVLSHLGYERMWVSYETDHWTPSLPYRLLARLAGGDRRRCLPPRVVREDSVDAWPHVRSGRVTRDDALKYFQTMFGECVESCE